MKDIIYFNKIFPYSEANGKPVHYAIPFSMSDSTWTEYVLRQGNPIAIRIKNKVEENGYTFDYIIWGPERTSDRYVIVREKDLP